MGPELIFPLFSRWAHVLAAIVLAGGVIFWRYVVLPSLNEHDSNGVCSDAIRKRWARWVMAAILFLLVSGLYNSYLKAIEFKLDPIYLALLTMKILLALLVFVWVSLLAGRSERAKRFRAQGTYWFDLTCLSILAIVLIGGYMKISPQQTKPKSSELNVTSSPSEPFAAIQLRSPSTRVLH